MPSSFRMLSHYQSIVFTLLLSQLFFPLLFFLSNYLDAHNNKTNPAPMLWAVQCRAEALLNRSSLSYASALEWVAAASAAPLHPPSSVTSGPLPCLYLICSCAAFPYNFTKNILPRKGDPRYKMFAGNVVQNKGDRKLSVLSR